MPNALRAVSPTSTADLDQIPEMFRQRMQAARPATWGPKQLHVRDLGRYTSLYRSIHQAVAVRYAHRVLGVRPNVTVLDLNYMQFTWFVDRAKAQPYWADLTFPGDAYGTKTPKGFVMADFLRANYKKWTIFSVGGIVPADRSWEVEYRLWPLGLASQLLRRDAAIKLDKWAARSQRLLPSLSWASPPLEGGRRGARGEEGCFEEPAARASEVVAWWR